MRTWLTRFAPRLALLLLLAALLCLTACGDDDDEPTGPDTTRPRVTSVSPAAGATDVPVDTPLTITFSEDIDVATMTAGSIVLSDYGPVTKGNWKAAGTRQLVYTPDEPLEYANHYQAVVDSALADLAGNTLAADFEWSFSTESFPLAEIDFPLAQNNTWLYQVVEFYRAGTDTTEYEGLDVLWAEGEISYEGRDGWLIRRFLLDEKAAGASALDEDFCYLTRDAFGLYRADPYRGDGLWRNLVLFGEPTFDDADFLLAGTPIHSDAATHGATRYTGPVGSFWADRVDCEYTLAGEITDKRRELYADGFGLVESFWQYANENDDVALAGRAELADAVNGPLTPWVELELEPNDGPSVAGAEFVEMTAIILGDAQLSDAGTILTPEDIDCDFFTCVNEDIDGLRIVQDFYRVEITAQGQYRFDLIYDQFDVDNDLDLYCFVDEGGGALRSVARADAAAGTPEYIVLLDAAPGTWYVGIQAWNTPVPETPVEYTLSLRPQATPIPVDKGEGREFLASSGK